MNNTTFIFDFARVLMFPRDAEYTGKLNPLSQQISKSQGSDFSVLDHFQFNEPLLKYIQFLKSNDIYLVVFTSGSIQEYPEIQVRIKRLFDKVITARDFTTTKQDPESYRNLLLQIGKKPEQCIFIDDSDANVKAAVEVGIKGIVYTSFEDLLKQIEGLSLS